MSPCGRGKTVSARTTSSPEGGLCDGGYRVVGHGTANAASRPGPGPPPLPLLTRTHFSAATLRVAPAGRATRGGGGHDGSPRAAELSESLSEVKEQLKQVGPGPSVRHPGPPPRRARGPPRSGPRRARVPERRGSE